MEFIPITNSSNLRGVHYDANTQVLTTQLNGGDYEYKGVPLDIYTGLLNADSKGKYMRANIIGKFESKKLAAE